MVSGRKCFPINPDSRLTFRLWEGCENNNRSFAHRKTKMDTLQIWYGIYLCIFLKLDVKKCNTKILSFSRTHTVFTQKEKQYEDISDSAATVFRVVTMYVLLQGNQCQHGSGRHCGWLRTRPRSIGTRRHAPRRRRRRRTRRLAHCANWPQHHKTTLQDIIPLCVWHMKIQLDLSHCTWIISPSLRSLDGVAVLASPRGGRVERCVVCGVLGLLFSYRVIVNVARCMLTCHYVNGKCSLIGRSVVFTHQIVWSG